MNIPNNETADKSLSTLPSGHDPQDKAYWYGDGEGGELHFVDQIAPRIGLNAQINPAKENKPWASDLVIDGQGDQGQAARPVGLQAVWG